MSNATSPSPPSFDVEPVSRLEPLRPMPISSVTRAMTEYQEGLHALLAATDWQTFLTNSGEERRFVVKSGWRKIGTWFGLDCELDAEKISVERDERGRILRARVVARVVAPNGRKWEDVGVCAADERHFTKPEHDVVSTAATRAINRATSDLVGMGELSAEEVADNVEPMLPEWAQAADQELEHEALGYLEQLFGGERAVALMRGINNRYGYVPNVCAGLIRAMHRMWQSRPEDMAHVDEQPPSTPPEP